MKLCHINRSGSVFLDTLYFNHKRTSTLTVIAFFIQN